MSMEYRRREVTPWTICGGLWLFAVTACLAGLVVWVVWEMGFVGGVMKGIQHRTPGIEDKR